MNGFVDLHIHSRHSSDGEWPVERICREADRLGMAAFSISDHDTTAGVAEAIAANPKSEVVPNVEISTRYGPHTFHLLAPFIDWQNPALEEMLMQIRRSRVEQAQGRVRRLGDLGFEIDFKMVSAELGDRSLTGPAIASILLESSRDPRLEPYRRSGERSPEVRFYRDFFLPGRPAYMPKRTVDLEDAVSLVSRLGGVATLAHPGLRPGTVEAGMLKTLRDRGLGGLEVFTSYHDSDTTEHFREMARRVGLVAVAGSDFHGRIKPRVAFGSIRNGDTSMLDELRHRRRPLESVAGEEK